MGNKGGYYFELGNNSDGEKKSIEKNTVHIMKNELIEVSNQLLIPNKDFSDKNVDKILELLHSYINKYDMVIYHIFTECIFLHNGDNNTRLEGNLISTINILSDDLYREKYIEANIEKQINEKCYNEDEISEQKYKEYREEQEKLYKDIKKIIIEIYDNVKKSINVSFEFDESSSLLNSELLKYKNQVEEKINDVKEESKKKIDYAKLELNQKVKDDINNFSSSFTLQLFSIVGIFTAMSFMVFGSLDSLGGIFNNIASTDILKNLIAISVWSICVVNLIFIFMYFIAIFIGLKNNKVNDYGFKDLRRNKLVLFTNLIILLILSVSSWLYFVDSKGLGVWFVNMVNKKPIWFSVFVLGVILFIFVFGLVWIFKDSREENFSKDKKVININDEAATDID